MFGFFRFLAYLIAAKDKDATAAGPFKPPGIDRLREIDQADCEYEDECIEIQGVVSPEGQGGWPASKDYQVHCFSFSAWRPVGKVLVEQKLTILRPVPRGDIPFSNFPRHSVHRIKVLLSNDRTRALFAAEEKLDEPDAELSAVAEKLQKPVIVSTSRFGDLILNRRIGWFEGSAEWNGTHVEIHLHTDEHGEIVNALKFAESLWDSQSGWTRKVDDYAVQELLALKNDSWLDEREKPLKPDEFKSRMKLESITVGNDGEFDFWHNDGELFWGHMIQVSGSLERGLSHADIPG